MNIFFGSKFTRSFDSDDDKLIAIVNITFGNVHNF